MKIDYELNNEEKESFIIDSEDKANWALRKLREKKEELDIVKGKADYERQLIEEWETRKSNPIQLDIEFFENQLNNYIENNISIGKKVETVNGTLRKKKMPVAYKYKDEDLLNYLKENNRTDLIKIKESPKWGDFKKTIVSKGNVIATEDGEILDFIEVEDNRYKTVIDID